MAGYAIRVSEDRLYARSRYAAPLSPLNRILYVLRGAVVARSGEREQVLDENSAWHAAGPCEAVGGRAGAVVLRYELVRAGTPHAAPGVPSTPLLEHAIVLDPATPYLMRCDRVDFDLGGEALPHRHRGGGIRCLIAGTLDLEVEGQPARVLRPGQAWFESGREPVYARASAHEPTSFIRCSVLPRTIQGQSSIVYLDPRDADSRPRKYTVFVDEPIDLPHPP